MLTPLGFETIFSKVITILPLGLVIIIFCISLSLFFLFCYFLVVVAENPFPVRPVPYLYSIAI